MNEEFSSIDQLTVTAEDRNRVKLDDQIQIAREMIAKSRSITVLTGAGISAESGVPTYRSENGLWNNFRAEDFSSVQAFEKDPKTVWDWYRDRRRVMALALPNEGHKALAKLEQRFSNFMVLTQNIDGLHQRAGTDNIVELHGSVWRLRCTSCGHVWEYNEYRNTRLADLPEVPTCISCRCNGIARPDVIWFEEPLKQDVWNRAVRATYCDTMLVVGTSAQVNPVASLPTQAMAQRARVIVINPERTPTSDIAEMTLLGTAGEILPRLAVEDTGIGTMHDMDMGRAMQRGLEKFYAKYPQFKEQLTKPGVSSEKEECDM